MKITKRYETKLETAEPQNILAILDAKLEATNPERVVDYVAFGIDNLNATIDRMKEAKKELDNYIKDAQSQIDIVKSGTAEWMEQSGVESLTGDRVSSMKITTPKETTELKVTDEEALINQGYFKSVLNKTEVKKALQNGCFIEGAELEITHNSDTLTVYKKRSNATKS